MDWEQLGGGVPVVTIRTSGHVTFNDAAIAAMRACSHIGIFYNPVAGRIGFRRSDAGGMCCATLYVETGEFKIDLTPYLNSVGIDPPAIDYEAELQEPAPYDPGPPPDPGDEAIHWIPLWD